MIQSPSACVFWPQPIPKSYWKLPFLFDKFIQQKGCVTKTISILCPSGLLSLHQENVQWCLHFQFGVLDVLSLKTSFFASGAHLQLQKFVFPSSNSDPISIYRSSRPMIWWSRNILMSTFMKIESIFWVDYTPAPPISLDLRFKAHQAALEPLVFINSRSFFPLKTQWKQAIATIYMLVWVLFFCSFFWPALIRPFVTTF